MFKFPKLQGRVVFDEKKYKPTKKRIKAEQRAAALNKAAVPDMTLPDQSPLVTLAETGQYTGKTDEDDKLEVSEIIKMLRNVDNEAERVMGNGYWVALVFPDTETCDAFKERAGWNEHSAEGAYVDGMAIAEKLGVELPPVAPLRFKSQRTDARLVSELGVFHPKKPGEKGS